ncbi:MAG: PBP1A family penicillin-binding protein [Bacilli bacterium]|nr:PBP1A family penicillin-binding protein [Bacilli bacterium]
MKKIMIILKILTFMFLSFIIVLLGFYVYAYITPKFEINNSKSLVFYDKNNNEFFSGEEYNNFTNIEEIPQDLINAIISVEDKNFYKHQGFDFLRILKAIFINIKSKSIKQGASTISQQLIKNLYLDFDQTWERKIEEAFLTFELEVHYEKDEILEAYLNTIDFGAGNYGIKEAAKYYFNKKPNELTIEESTLLVGIPKNPSYYNPITNFEASKKRQLTVLTSMVKNKYITEEEKNNIYNKELTFYAKHDKQELSSIYYYKDAVISELNKLGIISNSLIDVSGLKIYTNYDKEAQKILEKNIENEMPESNLQVASTIIEPKTGKIIALIGGNDYSKSQFNRVTSSSRQVGSTIKPFLYYAALENGFTPSTTFLSEKTTFNLGDQTYSPKNAGNIYANKDISLLAAIAYSDNIYALKTHLFLGEEALSEITKRGKINTKVKENASSALGTTEINMLDYANGFIALANEGIHTKPYLITKITDINNNIIYEHKPMQETVYNKKYTYILNNMLTNTYNYQMIDYTSPTLISVQGELSDKYAVKSGSTSTDFWTIGYNKNYLVMVWNGYDNNKEVTSSQSRIAKKIWAKTISKLPNKENSWYDIPKGITASIIEPISGKAAQDNGLVCYYEKGTEPTYEFIDIYDKISKIN